ncbi:unnamed protein product, partial [Cyprideis torosa]
MPSYTLQHRSHAVRDFYVGVFLALASSLLIGLSAIMKKHAFCRGPPISIDTPPKFLADQLWWTGMAMMGMGEALNFTAYAFAPVSVVAPLGALSLVFSCLGAAKFMQQE